jgi:hypothetical protein
LLRREFLSESSPVSAIMPGRVSPNQYDTDLANNSVTLTSRIIYQEATITSIDRTSAVEGAPGFTLTVNGLNLGPQSKVYWDDTELPTTYVAGSPGYLTARAGSTLVEQWRALVFGEACHAAAAVAQVALPRAVAGTHSQVAVAPFTKSAQASFWQQNRVRSSRNGRPCSLKGGHRVRSAAAIAQKHRQSFHGPRTRPNFRQHRYCLRISI